MCYEKNPCNWTCPDLKPRWQNSVNAQQASKFGAHVSGTMTTEHGSEFTGYHDATGHATVVALFQGGDAVTIINGRCGDQILIARLMPNRAANWRYG